MSHWTFLAAAFAIAAGVVALVGYCAVVAGARADRRSARFERTATASRRGPLRPVRGNEADVSPLRPCGESSASDVGPHAAPTPPDRPPSAA